MLDFRLHGNVHVLVGNNEGIGDVPYAGNDPLFWMHHCNIDRIWANWNRGGNTNPATPSWRDNQFTFADENCNPVSASIADFEDLTKLDYTYDSFLSVRPLLRVPPEYLILCVLHIIKIPPDPGPFTIALPSVARNGTIASRVARLRRGQRVRLVVSNLRAKSPPGTPFSLHLGLPKTTRVLSSREPAVGYVNFLID